MKITGQFILLFLVVNMSWGQDTDVTLPSPETAALFKYQDYPMDYSTGLPQISIPLFTVQNRSLSVPISISYHASGFKVADRDGPIAAGWSLNVGGMVSRTIKGDPDFGIYPFPNPLETNFSGQSGLAALEQIMNYESIWSTSGQWLDTEHDIFSYNFPGQSGKFLFNDLNGIKTPVLLPTKPLKVNPTFDAAAGLQGIKITDDKGDNYSFSGTESSGSGYTGFTLNNIVSANLKDVINYTYSSTPQERKYFSQNITVNDKWSYIIGALNNVTTAGSLQIIPKDVEQIDYYTVSRIQEIDFEQGKVEFILKGGINDDKDLIDFIRVKDRNGNIIRTIKFKRAPLHTIAVEGFFDTHKLTAIEIQDSNNSPVETYSFEYFPTVYSGNNDGNGIVNPRYIDFWGYYNASGRTQMIYHPDIFAQGIDGLTVTEQIPIGSTSADRDPKLEATRSGVLKKIFFPTGGHTEFDYEQNKYYSYDEGQAKDGPGLRVKQTITADGDGNTFMRTFRYGTDESELTAESGYGNIDLEPNLLQMKTTTLHKYFPPNLSEGLPTHRERTFYSGFVPSLGELASRPIIYTNVTEYKGTPTTNEGKTIYNYDNPKWGPGNLGSSGPEGILKWHIPSYKYWDTPVLKHQTDYKAIKNNGAITYNEVKKVSNVHTKTTSPANDIIGLHVQRRYHMPQDNPGSQYTSSILPQPFGEGVGYFSFGLEIYAHSTYKIPVGNKNLTSTTERLTNDDGTIVSTKSSYLYNPENYVSEITTESLKIDGTSSQNSSLKKEIKYAADSNEAPFGLMIGLNMLNFKVEEKDSFDGQLTNTSKINYKDWGNTIYKPEFIEVSKADDNLEPRTIYHSYNSKGNPQEVSQDNGPHTYYIWGYHDTQPIAKIDNFTQSQAASIQGLITAAKSASDDDNGAVGKEDTLRAALQSIRDNSALSNSFITTYTYDPFIGTTSRTDPRGYTAFYEYDAFNRLKVVRDADNNIVSDYDYSYKQPTN